MKINARKLETIRKTLGFNKETFAKFIQVSRPTYDNMLRNGYDFRSDTIEKVAKNLRISAKELIIF
jgi:DNA-binding XRE family transcriptional regulator